MSRRWINTLVIYDAHGRIVKREGYWYDGPLALCGKAFFDQDSYAFYSEGTESGSTIIGSVNNQQTLDTGTKYQCRILIQETGGADGSVNNQDWQYSHNSGTWTIITTTSSVVQAVDSDDLTNGADTTQRIGSGTYDATNGWVSEDGMMTSNAIAANNECEGLLSFQIIAGDVSHGDEILIRMNGMDSYTRNADIDVNKPTTRRVFVVS